MKSVPLSVMTCLGKPTLEKTKANARATIAIPILTEDSGVASGFRMA